LGVDPEALAIAQRYVDGEISVAKMTSAMSLPSCKGTWGLWLFPPGDERIALGRDDGAYARVKASCDPRLGAA
jgi:hypothetical protein